MKHYAYICGDPGIPLPGHKGASAHVASVVRAMRAANVTGELHAAAPTGGALDGVPIVPLPVAAGYRPGGSGGSRAAAAAEREARTFLASSAALDRIVPPVDFIYERYSLWHTAGLARARALDVPFVLEVNSPLPVEAMRYRSLANADLATGIAALLMRCADLVFCVSAQVADWAAGWRQHRVNLHVLPNGVDAELFKPAPAQSARPAPLPGRETALVAFCGSFRPWHGLDDLLAAFALLVREFEPRAHLLCVGDGPERPRLQARAAELGLARQVHFTGQIAQSEVPAWLGAADLAVAPYPQLADFYFSPLKLFEFLALELPVVGTALGQVPEILGQDGERGLLCPPGDVRMLAHSMARLLADRTAARVMGVRGREYVLEHATWQRRVAEILARVEALSC